MTPPNPSDARSSLLKTLLDALPDPIKTRRLAGDGFFPDSSLFAGQHPLAALAALAGPEGLAAAAGAWPFLAKLPLAAEAAFSHLCENEARISKNGWTPDQAACALFAACPPSYGPSFRAAFCAHGPKGKWIRRFPSSFSAVLAALSDPAPFSCPADLRSKAIADLACAPSPESRQAALALARAPASPPFSPAEAGAHARELARNLRAGYCPDPALAAELAGAAYARCGANPDRPDTAGMLPKDAAGAFLSQFWTGHSYGSSMPQAFAHHGSMALISGTPESVRQALAAGSLGYYQFPASHVFASPEICKAESAKASRAAGRPVESAQERKLRAALESCPDARLRGELLSRLDGPGADCAAGRPDAQAKVPVLLRVSPAAVLLALRNGEPDPESLILLHDGGFPLEEALAQSKSLFGAVPQNKTALAIRPFLAAQKERGALDQASRQAPGARPPKAI